MLLIAIDTSGRTGTVALCRGDADGFETLQLRTLEGGGYSERLLPVIEDLLQTNKLDKREIDAFVAVSGPGSFTGLRVGLATVKGLCEALGRPLATVSMLEALALVHGKGQVTAILDAGRGEAYVGEYRVAGENAELIRESMVKLAAFSSSGAAVLTSDEKVAEALGCALVDRVHADAIGRIGLRKLLGGELADVATVDVNYIRRSDAELFAKS